MPNPTMSWDKASLMELGRKHWKEFQPTKYQRLQSMHQLEPSLSAAVDLTLSAMQDAREAGYSQFEAWEKNRELFLLLPEEFGLDKEEPDNPAYDSLVEMNQSLDKGSIDLEK
jgi:hypothetical protein